MLAAPQAAKSRKTDLFDSESDREITLGGFAYNEGGLIEDWIKNNVVNDNPGIVNFHAVGNYAVVAKLYFEDSEGGAVLPCGPAACFWRRCKRRSMIKTCWHGFDVKILAGFMRSDRLVHNFPTPM